MCAPKSLIRRVVEEVGGRDVVRPVRFARRLRAPTSTLPTPTEHPIVSSDLRVEGLQFSDPGPNLTRNLALVLATLTHFLLGDVAGVVVRVVTVTRW